MCMCTTCEQWASYIVELELGTVVSFWKVQVLSLVSRWYLVTVSSRKEACCALMWKKATGRGWALCPCVTDEQEKEATLIGLSKNDVNPWVKTELLHKRYHLPILWHWAWSFQTQITAYNTQQWLVLYCCFCCFLWPWVCVCVYMYTYACASQRPALGVIPLKLSIF